MKRELWTQALHSKYKFVGAKKWAWQCSDYAHTYLKNQIYYWNESLNDSYRAEVQDNDD